MLLHWQEVTWRTGKGLKNTGQKQRISFTIFFALSENGMKKKKNFLDMQEKIST